jgi:hypothetical protein
VPQADAAPTAAHLGLGELQRLQRVVLRRNAAVGDLDLAGALHQLFADAAQNLGDLSARVDMSRLPAQSAGLPGIVGRLFWKRKSPCPGVWEMIAPARKRHGPVATDRSIAV